MSANPDSGSMVTYQFEVDGDTWSDWKQTVPRDKSLQQRIIELLEADAEGRVLEEKPDQEVVEQDDENNTEHGVGGSVGRDADAVLRSLDLPGSGSKYEARVDSLIAFYDHLREHEGQRVSKGELKNIVEERDLDVGYASFGSLWNNWVKSNASQDREKNTLAQLPGVEMDGDEYVYTAHE